MQSGPGISWDDLGLQQEGPGGGESVQLCEEHAQGHPRIDGWEGGYTRSSTFVQDIHGRPETVE